MGVSALGAAAGEPVGYAEIPSAITTKSRFLSPAESSGTRPVGHTRGSDAPILQRDLEAEPRNSVSIRDSSGSPH